MRIIYNNKIDDVGTAAITASSEEVNFDAPRVQDERLSVAWRSTSAGGLEWVKLDAGAGTTITVDTAAVLGHNLTSTAVVLIEGNATDAWGSATVSEAITFRAGAMIKFITSASRRFWRFSFTDTGITSGYVEIGRLFLGTYLQVRPSSFFDSIPFRHDRTDRFAYSQGGQLYADKGVQQVAVAYNFPNTTNAQKALMETMWNDIGMHTPMIFSNYDTEFTAVGPIYAHINRPMTFDRVPGDKWRFSLDVKEVK